MLKNKPDIGYIIKTLACVLAFIATVTYFSFVCGSLVKDYSVLINPSTAATVLWFGNLIVATLLFIAMSGLIAVLVRPAWIAFVACVIGSASYILILGPNQFTGAAAGILIIFLLVSLFFEVSQLENQINFSIHPLGGKKFITSCVLAILVSVAFGTGYVVDSTKNNYVLPPSFKSFYTQQITSVLQSVIGDQKGSAQQKAAALKQAEAKAESMFNDAEKNLKPQQKYISIVFGVVAFFVFQFLLLIVSMVSGFVTYLVFFILKITRFTHVAVEKRDVSRLTLKTVK
jgi:hypothetical protein